MIPLLTRWLQAVCSRDPNEVLALYTSDAVLLGTFAEEIKQGAELRDYFIEFLDKPELCGQLNSCVDQKMDEGLVLSGTYTFWWLGAGGPRSEQARFSFVFVPADGDWLILNHHSSVVPS